MSVPAPGAFAIDGSNVVAAAVPKAAARLAAAVAWCRAFRPDLPVVVFVDDSTWRRLDPAAQVQVRALGEVTVGAAGAAVDAQLLDHARRHAALVVSNDRFADHDDLRRGALLVQFSFTRGAFAPAAEATWFRTPGTAVRFELAQLRGS